MSELKNLSAILEGGAVPAGYNGKAIGKLSKTYTEADKSKAMEVYRKQSANCLRHTSNWKTAK